MISRRVFAGSAAAMLAAQEALPVAIHILPDGGVPQPPAVVFERAWFACPNPKLAMPALLSGRYPHAPGPPVLRHEPGAELHVWVSAAWQDHSSEAACRTTLAIRTPRWSGANPVLHPVSLIDVAPTMYALAGREIPAGMHGTDLTVAHPETVFAEGRLGETSEWRMLVRGVDKIVVRRNLEVLSLYNLNDDPAETENLAEQPGHRLKVDELAALVRAAMKRTGDGMDPSGLKRR